MKAIIEGIEIECTVQEFKELALWANIDVSKVSIDSREKVLSCSKKEVVIRRPKKKEFRKYDYQKRVGYIARELMKKGEVTTLSEAYTKAHVLVKQKEKKDTSARAPIFVVKPGFPEIRHISSANKERFIKYLEDAVINGGYVLSYPSLAATYEIANYTEWEELIESVISNQTTILDYYGRRDGHFVLEMQTSSKVSRPIHMLGFKPNKKTPSNKGEWADKTILRGFH